MHHDHVGLLEICYNLIIPVTIASLAYENYKQDMETSHADNMLYTEYMTPVN